MERVHNYKILPSSSVRGDKRLLSGRHGQWLWLWTKMNWDNSRRGGGTVGVDYIRT